MCVSGIDCFLSSSVMHTLTSTIVLILRVLTFLLQFPPSFSCVMTSIKLHHYFIRSVYCIIILFYFYILILTFPLLFFPFLLPSPPWCSLFNSRASPTSSYFLLLPRCSPFNSRPSPPSVILNEILCFFLSRVHD